MASRKQVKAAKRTIANLPLETRRDLGRQAARARMRGGKPGHDYQDRTRQELYEVAKRKGVRGRSKMGKWQLIDAIRRAS